MAGLFFGIALNLISALSSSRVLALAQEFAMTEVEFRGWLQGSALIEYGITGVLFLAWLHQAYSNLSLTGTKKTKYSPEWAVGCWFVPFVNVGLPLVVVSELWGRSSAGNTVEALQGKRAPILVVCGRLAFLTSLLRERVAAAVNALAALSDVTAVVAGGLAVMTVRGIDHRQQFFSGLPIRDA
jgi:hypothetical protein